MPSAESINRCRCRVMTTGEKLSKFPNKNGTQKKGVYVFTSLLVCKQGSIYDEKWIVCFEGILSDRCCFLHVSSC